MAPNSAINWAFFWPKKRYKTGEKWPKQQIEIQSLLFSVAWTHFGIFRRFKPQKRYKTGENGPKSFQQQIEILLLRTQFERETLCRFWGPGWAAGPVAAQQGGHTMHATTSRQVFDADRTTLRVMSDSLSLLDHRNSSCS